MYLHSFHNVVRHLEEQSEPVKGKTSTCSGRTLRGAVASKVYIISNAAHFVAIYDDLRCKITVFVMESGGFEKPDIMIVLVWDACAPVQHLVAVNAVQNI